MNATGGRYYVTDAARNLAHLSRTRIAVIDKLRLAFERRGFDVRFYSNDQVATALRQAAAETEFNQDRFVCAFRRLHLSNHPRG